MRRAVCVGCAALGLHTALAARAGVTAIATPPTVGPRVNVPNFAKQVVDSGNNQGLPFFVIDKGQATVWVFTPQGGLLGTSAALLGLAIGDQSVPGIGERRLASILPTERTTPAGRFASALGRNLQGHEVLWVDYASGVSLHRIIPGQRQERRAERLATPTPNDNRITYGCINVPTAFFNVLVRTTVRKKGGIVYVLPDTRPLEQVFTFLVGRSQLTTE